MLDETAEIHSQMLIGGHWVDSASGETIAIENPGRRTVLGHVPRGDAVDVARAVEAASSAFPSWSKVPPRERGRMLLKIAEAIPKTGESARIASYQAVTGDMLVYWLVRPLNRLADLDKQSIGRDLLVNAYGQSEGNRFFHSGLENVDQLQREIVFYREDLSNPPE